MSLDRKIDRPSAYEIIPNRLFYTALRTLPKETPTSTFFCIDSQLVYWNFFLDFGPLNLGQLYRFCSTLNSKLKSEQHKKKAIYYYSGTHGQKRANAVFLICAWKMLYMGSSAEDAFEIFKTMYPGFPPFHDASPCACTYNLSILDCLMGLQKAKQYKFFDFDNFDPDEYEYYEQVENGDLNWIAKDKFVAFAGPHNSREVSREGCRTLTPDDYIPYFKKTGVKLVVRLNKKYYDERKFINAGIRHAEIYYLDGSCPPVRILKKVIESFESTDGAIAVHCKAGLGRTGTCIGCYIMKHYKFTAAEIIGWMRICRPGCVIGPQQHFMKEMEQQMWQEGEAMRARVQRNLPPPSQSQSDYDEVDSGLKEMSVNSTDEAVTGRAGQAEALRTRREEQQRARRK